MICWVDILFQPTYEVTRGNADIGIRNYDILTSCPTFDTSCSNIILLHAYKLISSNHLAQAPFSLSKSSTLLFCHSRPYSPRKESYSHPTIGRATALSTRIAITKASDSTPSLSLVLRFCKMFQPLVAPLSHHRTLSIHAPKILPFMFELLSTIWSTLLRTHLAKTNINISLSPRLPILIEYLHCWRERFPKLDLENYTIPPKRQRLTYTSR